MIISDEDVLSLEQVIKLTASCLRMQDYVGRFEHSLQTVHIGLISNVVGWFHRVRQIQQHLALR